MKPQNQKTQTHDPQTLQSLHDVQAGIQRLLALADDLSSNRDFLSAQACNLALREGWESDGVRQRERRIHETEAQRQRYIDRAAQLQVALEAALLGRSA